MVHFKWEDHIPDDAVIAQVMSAVTFIKEWQMYFPGRIHNLQYKLTDDFLLVMVNTSAPGCVHIGPRGKWRNCRNMKTIKKAFEAEL